MIYVQMHGQTYSCIQVCMKCHMNGAAAIVVFGALANFRDAKVPVRKVRFVSGTPFEKSAGVYANGVITSSMVPF